MGLLRHRHKAELELRPGLDHAGPLVPDVLQRGGDVDLLGALGHAVEDHVDEDVGAGATNTVTREHSLSSGQQLKDAIFLFFSSPPIARGGFYTCSG